MTSGPQTSNNGQIQRSQPKPEAGLAKLLQQLGPEMSRALPKHLNADRMARVALTALRTTKNLAQVTPASFAACIMTLAQIGLEPCTPLGHAYLIPRMMKGPDGRKAMTCTLIIGYQGLIELARRSGQVLAIWATPVYDADRFVVKYGLAPTVEHEPNFDSDRSPQKLRYVYAAARLKDTAEPVFVVLTRAEIEAARKRGASGQGVTTPWDTDYEPMALKTAVRRLYRWLPKSIEVASALAVDEAHDHGRVGTSVLDEGVKAIVEGQGLELPAETEAEVLDVAQTPEAIEASPVEQADGSVDRDPPKGA